MPSSLRTAPPLAIVVTGPAGAGKTTVGRALADALGWNFHDGDAFHSPENIRRMRHGVGLSDAERAPWLAALRDLLARAIDARRPVVLACSALRRVHRRQLAPDHAPPGAIRFVFLEVPPAVLRQRLTTRAGHFAGASLLDSQLATLETPGDGEALRLDGERPVPELVAAIRQATGA